MTEEDLRHKIDFFQNILDLIPDKKTKLAIVLNAVINSHKDQVASLIHDKFSRCKCIKQH